MRVLRLLFILGALSELEGSALSDTNGPLSVLAQRIAVTDRIIATNWAASMFGEAGFCIPITGEKVKGIVKAVSEATHFANQEHPAFEWDWELRFYRGTNFLAAICLKGDTFLTDGVYHDPTGMLEQVYRNLVNREYLASVVYRKCLDILSSHFPLFPLRPPWFDAFQPLPRPLHFRHYLFDCRRPDEWSGGFVPRLQELLNGLL
jgi:hypothetical protein